MDFMTILGAIVGALAIGFVLHHGHMMQFILNFEAFILIFGGTAGSVMIAYPFSVLKFVPSVLLKVIFPPKGVSSNELITAIAQLAAKSKREGAYSLSEDIGQAPHPFLGDCLAMLVDELDYEVMEEMLEQELVSTRTRHLQIANIFRSAGTYAPIFGLLGTLIGVVQVLRNITDPQSMGASMAIAMTASFYGIFSANFLFLPISNKLNFYSEQEYLTKELISKGSLYIHKGDTPWEITRKLSTFLSHQRRNGKYSQATAASKARV